MLADDVVSEEYACPDNLFVCETDRAERYALICATEVEVGERWENIQYRYGADGVKPELVYPGDPSQGAKSLFFSHTAVGSDYRVSVRFVSGDYTYRVYSNSGQENAGVRVFDAPSGLLSDIHCVKASIHVPGILAEGACMRY
ncbi:MAG: hypothetical protein U1F34_01310 [Gammaproteobacteria bacterium]